MVFIELRQIFDFTIVPIDLFIFCGYSPLLYKFLYNRISIFFKGVFKKILGLKNVTDFP